MTTTPVHSITDEQIAEIEQRASMGLSHYVHGVSSYAVISLITRLREAEKDAARMEWLASQCEMRYGHRDSAQYSADFGIFFMSDRASCRPDDLREAIDTAMQEPTK